MKKLFLTSLVLLSYASVDAQFAFDYLRAADDYYRKGDYFSATQYYEKYLDAGKSRNSLQTWNPYNVHNPGANASKKERVEMSTRQEAVYNLAQSYRLLNYPAKAEPAYREAAEFDKALFPFARYWHATTLRALEKFPEAELAFTTFLNEYTVIDKYSSGAKKEIANLKFIQVQMKRPDLSLFSVVKASGDTGALYAPVAMPDNTIYFTSTMADASAPKNNVHKNRVYEAVYSEGEIRSISRIALPEEKDIHQGVIAVTPDHNTLFLTRWITGKAKKSAAIYTSLRIGKQWGIPMLADATINVEGANNQQPFVSPDGKYLLFSSDRPGGYGGFDLWYAEIDASGNPSNLKNMGSNINTADDEQAPFYHIPSKSLIFSSNGRTGMGGYDFFQSKGTVDNLAVPVNFGYPVNSVKDDIYFTSRSGSKNVLQNALISSDRSAACCLQLFSVNKQNVKKQISGIVVSCEGKTPIVGASVNVVDPKTNSIVFSKTTDMNGRYYFTLDEFQDLKATASFGGFTEGSLQIKIPSDEELVNLVAPELCLVPVTLPPVDVPIVLNNVYYEFDKWDLKPASYPELDKLVTLLEDNPTARIELSAHTDSKGSDEYNNRLSERRAESVVNYLISKGIDKSRLEIKGYGETVPVAPNTNEDGSDNPEGREKNRRTEFKVLKNN